MHLLRRSWYFLERGALRDRLCLYKAREMLVALELSSYVRCSAMIDILRTAILNGEILLVLTKFSIR